MISHKKLFKNQNDQAKCLKFICTLIKSGARWHYVVKNQSKRWEFFFDPPPRFLTIYLTLSFCRLKSAFVAVECYNYVGSKVCIVPHFLMGSACSYDQKKISCSSLKFKKFSASALLIGSYCKPVMPGLQ